MPTCPRTKRHFPAKGDRKFYDATAKGDYWKVIKSIGLEVSGALGMDEAAVCDLGVRKGILEPCTPPQAPNLTKQAAE